MAIVASARPLRALGLAFCALALFGCGSTTSQDISTLKKGLPPGKETTAAELNKSYGKAFRRISSDHASPVFKEEMTKTWKVFGGATEERKAEAYWDKTVQTWWFELERGYGRIDFEVLPDGRLKVLHVEEEAQVDFKLRPFEKQI